MRDSPKYLLALIFISALIIPSVQAKNELSEYKNLARKYYRQGDIKNATKWIEKAVGYSEKKYGKAHKKTLRIKLSVIELYLRTKNVEKAEAVCLEIISSTKESDDMNVKAKNYLAKISISKKDFKKAEAILVKLLKLRQASFNQRKENTSKNIHARTLAEFQDDLDASKQELGRYYAFRGKLDKGEALFRETIKSSEKVKDRGLALFFSLQALGHFYNNNKLYAKAAKTYERMLLVSTKRSGPAHVTNHSLMTELANIYFSLKQYSKAEQYIKKSLKFTELYSDGPSERTGIRKLKTIRLLADFYFDTKRYKESQQYYLQALPLAKKILTKKHPVYHHLITTLASSYKKIKDYDTAELYYIKSLDLSKEINNKNFTLASRRMLADLYSMQGLKKKAIIQLSKALKLSESSRGKTDSYTVEIKEKLVALTKTHPGK